MATISLTIEDDKVDLVAEALGWKGKQDGRPDAYIKSRIAAFLKTTTEMKMKTKAAQMARASEKTTITVT